MVLAFTFTNDMLVNILEFIRKVKKHERYHQLHEGLQTEKVFFVHLTQMYVQSLTSYLGEDFSFLVQQRHLFIPRSLSAIRNSYFWAD